MAVQQRTRVRGLSASTASSARIVSASVPAQEVGLNEFFVRAGEVRMTAAEMAARLIEYNHEDVSAIKCGDVEKSFTGIQILGEKPLGRFNCHNNKLTHVNNVPRTAVSQEYELEYFDRRNPARTPMDITRMTKLEMIYMNILFYQVKGCFIIGTEYIQAE